ncbi:transglutaminase family protein [Salipiger mucosus]|uniref:Transglutaminase-like domain-containing protein n=1 Tax=Salipiger mucosus DSM 16094 TaxID=1123237 RepID=S9Q3H6_9RHOB|nr:transglutaminase family protein [Salipiger mucosus]EPX75891.1 hypothetical protein Salmuc_00994 [Salipiger mucosus DSM 16094]
MSMTYDIRLRIAYAYDSPAASSRAMLRMMPRTLPGQQLLYGVLGTDPAPSYRRDDLDFFGNATTQVAHDMRLRRIAFSFEGRVRRSAFSGGLDLSPRRDALARELAAAASIAPDSPHHFLGASPRVPHEPEIAAFAQETVEGGMSTMAAVDAISRRLHDEFTFDPSATEVTTTPIEAFAARRGVCQDISHVMIGALRSLSIPAGYVSGFLRTIPPAGRPRLEGADAMHAWVRAWCGTEMGWLEFDPTNAIRAGTDHVTVALGRDYSDVAPAKGSLRSAGSHASTHQVDVIPV